VGAGSPVHEPLTRVDSMLRPILLFCVLVALVAGGCSKGPSGQKGPEASLPELTRALQTWYMAKGAYPSDLNQLTNFPTLQGKCLPTAPAGKKLAIDPATRQVVFADQ
jgi:hypothetical protein